jgi:hypothetical protein
MTKWLPFQQSVVGVCLNLREVTALWRFNGCSDGNFDVVVLQCRQSEGGMNSFATEAASVINRRVAQEDQTLPKLLGRICMDITAGVSLELYFPHGVEPQKKLPRALSTVSSVTLGLHRSNPHVFMVLCLVRHSDATFYSYKVKLFL